MFLRILLIILVCAGIGTAPQFSWAESHHRLAKVYADRNDVERASAYFGLALKNAAPKQVAVIASDYAAFLLETGDLHKAELILRQALTQSPHNEELIRTLARCLVQQDKVIEGLRYFKSICSETEAREEIAAICRERGNADMLAAMEKKWGAATSEPVFVAATPKPALPTQAATTAKTLVAAATPVVSPSKSDIFDTRIPIPVPKSVSSPIATSSPRLAPSPPLPPPQRVATAGLPQSAPLPVATLSVAKKRTPVSENPVKLSAVRQPVLSEEYPPKPEVALQPRKHYVVNAAASADLDALFPIKPVVATVPTR